MKFDLQVSLNFSLIIFLRHTSNQTFVSKGPKFRQRFLCEVRVQGFPYVGAGNSTNKKDAEKNASKDFVSFLVRSGKIRECDVPNEEGNEAAAGSSSNVKHQQDNNYGNYGQQQSGNLSNFLPNQLGEAYQPYNRDRSLNRDQNAGPHSYMDRAQEQARLEEAESLDVNAAIHGNWTIENAKSKLNQFMQANKIQGEFKYSAIGPDHNRYFYFYIDLNYIPMN